MRTVLCGAAKLLSLCPSSIHPHKRGVDTRGQEKRMGFEGWGQVESGDKGEQKGKKAKVAVIIKVNERRRRMSGLSSAHISVCPLRTAVS